MAGTEMHKFRDFANRVWGNVVVVDDNNNNVFFIVTDNGQSPKIQ
jgi:hypothetical protein